MTRVAIGRKSLGVFLFGVSLVALSRVAALHAQTAAADLLKVSWQDYIADYQPDMERGLFGLMASYAVFNKYERKQVDWVGAFRALQNLPNDRKAASIGMPPITVKVPSGDVVIDTVTGQIEASSVTDWSQLKQ